MIQARPTQPTQGLDRPNRSNGDASRVGVIRAVKTTDDNGSVTPFLPIVGASSAGKSSLARAGLIPRLTMPGVAPSIDLWRIARMKPGEGQAGPIMALANALFVPEALPELSRCDYPTPQVLAENLAGGGTPSAQPIVRALARVAEDAQRERHTDQAMRPALVQLIDQFEELFARG